jgi:hypothetical protein
MAQTPEGKVKDAVKKELRKRDIWYFMPMQNGFGVVGIPDFICCWEGKFLAIETKAPGKRGQTTANQDRIISEIKDHWGKALVVDDVSQLIDYLEAYYEQGRG